MKPRCGVVIFAYDCVEGLEHLLPVVQSAPVDCIILAHEGDATGLDAVVSKQHDPRITLIHSPVRLGKAQAYNRVIPFCADSDIVFLVSADIDFGSAIFDAISPLFSDPHVGVVVPRVMPEKVTSGIERVAAVLWALHDIQLRLLSGGKALIHGGEFLAIRQTLLTPIPEHTVNEDAYLCIHAEQSGYAFRYFPEHTVRNRVPSALGDLLTQRVRINYGHRQLSRFGKRPEVLSSLRLRSLGNTARVLLEFARSYPRDLPYLAMLVMEEIYANAMAIRDMGQHVDHSKWRTVSMNVTSALREANEEG